VAKSGSLKQSQVTEAIFLFSSHFWKDPCSDHSSTLPGLLRLPIVEAHLYSPFAANATLSKCPCSFPTCPLPNHQAHQWSLLHFHLSSVAFPVCLCVLFPMCSYMSSFTVQRGLLPHTGSMWHQGIHRPLSPCKIALFLSWFPPLSWQCNGAIV